MQVRTGACSLMCEPGPLYVLGRNLRLALPHLVPADAGNGRVRVTVTGSERVTQLVEQRAEAVFWIHSRRQVQDAATSARDGHVAALARRLHTLPVDEPHRRTSRVEVESSAVLVPGGDRERSWLQQLRVGVEAGAELVFRAAQQSTPEA